jgi:nucleotide-binding universal stress UspA family protein
MCGTPVCCARGKVVSVHERLPESDGRRSSDSKIVVQIDRFQVLLVSGEDPISAIKSRRWALPRMAARRGFADAEKPVMKTILCAVDESPGAAEAVAVASGLSNDLGLRLVLAHVVDGYRRTNGGAIGGAQSQQGGQRLLERVARKHNLESAADRRTEVGDRASELSRIAGEEAAVVIVVGSRSRYRRRRSLMSRLSTELRSTAPCPIVVVPPRPRR